MMVDEHLTCRRIVYNLLHKVKSARGVEVKTEYKVGLPDNVIGLLLVLVIPQYLLRIGQPLQEVGVSIRHNDSDLLTV